MKQNEKKETGFRRLEQNLSDVVKESQIKLGYAEGSLQLFYPLSSLNHALQTELDEEGMQEYLGEFAKYAEDRLGGLGYHHKKDRFAITIPSEGAKYIHEQVEVSEFLRELVQVTGMFGCTMEQAKEVFYKYSDHVKCKEMDNGEFDLLMYFEDGDPDDYLYCFHQEGEQVIYHRYKKEDYEEFGF